jgi:adenylate cyclase
VYIAHFGLILYRARRYNESIAQCQKALVIDPHYANALWFLALSLEQTGDLPQAITKLELAVKLTKGTHYCALLGRAYALAGEQAKAVAILEELKVLSQQRYVSPFDFAVVYSGLCNWTAVFQFLEDAYEQQVFRIVELKLPSFDNLRSDPRWQDLVRRVCLLQ